MEEYIFENHTRFHNYRHKTKPVGTFCIIDLGNPTTYMLSELGSVLGEQWLHGDYICRKTAKPEKFDQKQSLKHMWTPEDEEWVNKQVEQEKIEQENIDKNRKQYTHLDKFIKTAAKEGYFSCELTEEIISLVYDELAKKVVDVDDLIEQLDEFMTNTRLKTYACPDYNDWVRALKNGGSLYKPRS